MRQAARSHLVARRPAFDHVGRDRERPAGESDDGGTSGKFAPNQPDRFEDETEIRLDVDRTEQGDVGRRPDRRRDHRTLRGQLHLHAHGFYGQHHVGEQHRGIRSERLCRPDRDLGAQRRRPGDVHDRMPLAQGEIAGQ